jgi:hypothetical protein
MNSILSASMLRGGCDHRKHERFLPMRAGRRGGFLRGAIRHIVRRSIIILFVLAGASHE